MIIVQLMDKPSEVLINRVNGYMSLNLLRRILILDLDNRPLSKQLYDNVQYLKFPILITFK